MTRKRDEDRVAKAAALYSSGKTTREIGAELTVDPRTVARWVGGAVRRPGPRPRAGVDRKILELRTVQPDPEREAQGLPPREHLSFAEIARQVGMSKTGVRMRYYALTGRARPDRS